MATMRIVVLTWADSLAWFSIWTMTTYLTDVWKLGISHATAIVNIWMGIAFTSQLVFRYLVDTVFGHFPILLISSTAYCIGLGFLWMSTPPVLSNSTGSCSDYKPECIGHTQKILFYIGLPLIALGMSGHVVSIIPFTAEQNQNNFVIKMSGKMQILGCCTVVIVPIVGALALPFIGPWSVRFGIPVICTIIATFVFLSSSCSYIFVGPQGSPLTIIFSIIQAAVSRITLKLPDDPKELYERDDEPNLMFLPHTRGLRWLDKAAIKLQGENNRIYFSVTEVEITKMVIRVLPMWISFIMCGVVSSLGNTYFQEQANRMNPKIGKSKVPLQILQLVYELSKQKIFDNLYEVLIKYLTRLKRKRNAPVIGAALAMIFSILCCIIAAKVEARRLHIVQIHGLLDKPDESIPMSMFWLVPQYLLLAGLDSFIMKSVSALFSTQIPPSLALYFLHFGFGIYGLGCLSSVLSVFTIGKISERRGNSNWFQFTLNQSRLDNYYWTLAALSTVNFILFIYIGSKKLSGLDDEQPARTPGGEYTSETVSGCCCFQSRVSATVVSNHRTWYLVDP